MLIAVPKEPSKETRVPIIPQVAKKMIQLGAEIHVEAGVGESIKISDQEYEEVGVKIISDRKKLIESGDLILRLQEPDINEIQWMKKSAIHVSHFDPFNSKKLLQEFKEKGVSAISMEMIPRTTKAQKMDSLSSQASLAGYTTVILAAERLDKVFPMMMTPSGTISPTKVFIIGVGVAGLQAIATAKRLGARVEAFDTRPVVEEQVQSLGAKFLKVDLGETGETKDGYAKELTPEQLAIQQKAMAKACIDADIVITTAKLFARKAPVIITKEVVEQMKPGSIIVDMAVESGGNVEGSVSGKEIDVNGVTIIGLENLPGRTAVNASQMYANNLFNMLDEFWNKETKEFELNMDDEIIQGCLITHSGDIQNEQIKKFHA
ncbi:MAG: NAD(P) transhydrogenase subunit alpha [bacterium]|jgi:NAD(P) transhydrogenase subunit alpha